MWLTAPEAWRPLPRSEAPDQSSLCHGEDMISLVKAIDLWGRRRSMFASVLPHRTARLRGSLEGGNIMYRTFWAAALLALAIAAPMQDAAAQNPLGGALVGGAAGAIVGGALGGGRGAAIGAIVGGASGAIIASQGQLRPGGYRYYQSACYLQRPDGAWVVVAPERCAMPAAAPVAVVAPPPPVVVVDPLRDRLLQLRGLCDAGDRGACVRLGIIIGENRARVVGWRRQYPDVFFYER
jgi:hypothetical protein